MPEARPSIPTRTLVLFLGLACLSVAQAGSLEADLGRSEVRILSAPYPLVAGRTVEESGLVPRLLRLGYERVREQPTRPGEFFFGHERFWIFRRAHRWNGIDHAPSLIGLELRKGDGMILGAAGIGDRRYPLERAGLLWLEPEVISESLAGDRAERELVPFERLPRHAWQALLAAEDARYFDHAGVDGMAVARAALANLKSRGISQGGSTITQQLIKNRDLTPKRSLPRKASEALRALALEAEYSKTEILEAYLNQVYYGHVDGLAIHGIGAAARVYFSKEATKLTLAESALLAAIVQGPNRLSPIRHAGAAQERRDWILSRLLELKWVESAAVAEAGSREIELRRSAPVSNVPTHFLSWVHRITGEQAGARLDSERGVVVETTLDPYLQSIAEQAVEQHLANLRNDHRRLRDTTLSAALIAIDAGTGDVLAYVGGDPAKPGDAFDRVRMAERQPGSTVKPLVLLEAFDGCGSRDPLHPASRVADEPVSIDLPPGDWEPENYDGRYRGVIDVRTALTESRNVPLVRIARWCGWEPTARMFERAGLSLPDDPPPSFVLGAVETTPLRLARAYTVIANQGELLEPLALRRIETPAGHPLARLHTQDRRVVPATVAYLVGDLMQSAVEYGTARVGKLEGFRVSAKTGSTQELRDAWFAGHAGSVVTVVWVGLDDGGSLGLPGSVAAGPIWKEFMTVAAPGRPIPSLERPGRIVERYIDSGSGLLVRERNRQSKKEIFRPGALPPRDRFWRADREVPVVR